MPFFFPVSVSEDKEDALVDNASDSNDWLTLLPQLEQKFSLSILFPQFTQKFSLIH